MSKLLLISIIMSNFSYFPLIWLFRSKGADNVINRTHKRALEPYMETINLRLKNI